MPRWMPVLMLTWLLPACSGTGVLNALTPGLGVTVTRNVAYAPGDRHSLDVYSGRETGAPVVVVFYGGGWTSGERSMYQFVGMSLAQRGFVVVIPDYRVYPEASYPTFVEDGADAVAWTKAHIGRYGGDPSRVFLLGHSAGAYIAALLTLDRDYLGKDGMDPDRDISGMIGLAGPYDFLPLREAIYETIFAPAGDLTRTQPIAYARADAPPMLLLTGADDTTVLPKNTRNLAARITELGGRAEVKTYRGAGHTLIIAAMAGPLSWIAPVLDDCTTFLRAQRASR